jgi:alpha-glucosidase
LRNDSPLRPDLIEGDYAPIKVADDHVIAYARGQHVQVFVNLSAQTAKIDLPAGRIWLNNYPDATPTLQPYQAILIEVN